jgi:Na+-driven multidrug efflux pump
MVFAGGLRGGGYPLSDGHRLRWNLVRATAARLSLCWGLGGAWSAMALDQTLRGTFSLLRFRSGRWKNIHV